MTDTSSNGWHPLPLDTARRLLGWNIEVIQVGWGSKNPNRPDWQKERHDEKSIETAFRGKTNIGVRVGQPTPTRHPFVDSDNDALECVRAAPFYLPATGMVWGRPSKRRSHYGYTLESAEGASHTVYLDPMLKGAAGRGRKATLCELRFNGHTLVPGSVNLESGTPEWVDWEPGGDGPPATETWERLVRATEHVAAAGMVGRYWFDGARNVMALPLAGFLAHGGMPLEQAELFFRAVCAASLDTQLDNRLGVLRRTYAKHDKSAPVTGGPTLAAFLSDIAVRQLRDWLRLGSVAQPGEYGPDGFRLTAVGDADRFARLYSGTVLHCAVENQWYIYTGARWEVDRSDQVLEFAKQTAYAFRKAVGDADPANYGTNGVGTYQQCVKYSVAMEGDRNLQAMLHLAGSKREIAVVPEQFDRDPFLLNTPSGTLVFNSATGTVTKRAHRAEDLLTKVTAGDWEEGSGDTHPLVEQTLARFLPEPERRDLIQEAFGAALTGLPKRQAIQLYGPHDAGKSTLLNVARTMMGDYGGSLSASSLTKNPIRGGDTPRPDLVAVVDKRVVAITEVGPDDRLDVELFKVMTSGGDRIKLRGLYERGGGRDVVFTPLLLMAGNKPYGPPPGEEAAWARLEVLHCEHVVPSTDRDAREERDLFDMTITGAAWMAFAVVGFQRLYGEKRGQLVGPDSSQLAKTALRDARDPFTEVIARLFDITHDPKDGVLVSEAWDRVRGWLEESGERVRNPARVKGQFLDAIERRGVIQQHSSARFANREHFVGLRGKEWANFTPP